MKTLLNQLQILQPLLIFSFFPMLFMRILKWLSLKWLKRMPFLSVIHVSHFQIDGITAERKIHTTSLDKQGGEGTRHSNLIET